MVTVRDANRCAKRSALNPPVMEFQFDQFDTACFRADPRRTELGPWTVAHVSFATPSTAHRAPLVFIGGAFQNAWSFCREVKHFLPQRPIVIVDLPGQGQNNQLSGELDFRDLADLLRQFLDIVALDRGVPVGLSYGSGIAFTFAQRFPHRVERLLLGGITKQIRPRVDKALRSPLYVTIPSIGASGDAVLLPASQGARAIFLHDAFGSLGKGPVATVDVPIPTIAGTPKRRVSLAERLVSLPEA